MGIESEGVFRKKTTEAEWQPSPRRKRARGRLAGPRVPLQPPATKLLEGTVPGCAFAVELVRVLADDDLAELALQEERALFETLAELHLPESTYSVGLRYSADPADGGLQGRVRCHLLFRVQSPDPGKAEVDAIALWESVHLSLPSSTGAWSFSSVTDPMTLGELFAVRPGHFAEITRRHDVVAIDGRNDVNLLYPWSASTGQVPRLLGTLLATGRRVCFQVWFRPTDVSEEEREFLRANVECCTGPSTRISPESAGQVLKVAQWLAQDLDFGNLVEMRVGLAADHPLPAALVQVAGHAVTVPAGTLAGMLVGGFAARTFTSAEFGEATDFWTLGFGEPASRLHRVFSTGESSCAWRLPPPTDGGLPGIHAEPIRPMALPDLLPSQGMRLGDHPNPPIPIHLGTADRALHTYVVGQTGTGKSTLLLNMIAQDMERGAGVGVLDPHGDLVQGILERIPAHRLDDVILFDPADHEFPVGLNLLEAKGPYEQDFVIQEMIEIFYRLFDPNRTGMVGPQWEHWARSAALTLTTTRPAGTLIDIPFLFTDPDYRDRRLLDPTLDPLAKSFWEKQLARTSDFHKSEMLNYFVSKFGRFLSNAGMRNIIGQARSSFDLRQVMDQGRILLVNLSKGRMGELNSATLGMMFVSKFFLAAASRADVPREGRRPFYLYVDEFQNFTTHTFGTILSEARKFGLSLVLAHQFTSQLPPEVRSAVRGNVGTTVAFRTGIEDAQLLAPNFDPWVDDESLARLPNFHAYVRMMIDGYPAPPVMIRSAPPAPLTSEPGWVDRVLRATRENYARPRAVVEAEIQARLGLASSWTPMPPPAGSRS